MGGIRSSKLIRSLPLEIFHFSSIFHFFPTKKTAFAEISKTYIFLVKGPFSCENSRKSVKISGDRWKSMRVYENLWESTEIDENLWKATKSNENLWKSVEIDKFPWNCMKGHDNQRNSSVRHETHWKTLDEALACTAPQQSWFNTSRCAPVHGGPSELTYVLRSLLGNEI